MHCLRLAEAIPQTSSPLSLHNCGCKHWRSGRTQRLPSCGQKQHLAQRCPPSCNRRQTPRSAGSVAASAAVDSTLACRWSSFSPSEWALRFVLRAIDRSNLGSRWNKVHDYAGEAAWFCKLSKPSCRSPPRPTSAASQFFAGRTQQLQPPRGRRARQRSVIAFLC